MKAKFSTGRLPSGTPSRDSSRGSWPLMPASESTMRSGTTSRGPSGCSCTIGTCSPLSGSTATGGRIRRLGILVPGVGAALPARPRGAGHRPCPSSRLRRALRPSQPDRPWRCDPEQPGQSGPGARRLGDPRLSHARLRRRHEGQPARRTGASLLPGRRMGSRLEGGAAAGASDSANATPSSTPCSMRRSIFTSVTPPGCEPRRAECRSPG